MTSIRIAAAALAFGAVAACAKTEPRAVDTGAVRVDTTKAAATTPATPTTSTPGAPATSAALPDSNPVVTPSGYGKVRIGASADELATAVGTKIPPSHSADQRACRYVALASLPSGMRVMLANDSVARIDVTAAGPRTAQGIGIGDLESKLTAAYAGAVVRPNKYTGPVGHDVIVNAAGDSTHRLVFETDGKKVVRFRAGRQPAVDLVEGCG